MEDFKKVLDRTEPFYTTEADDLLVVESGRVRVFIGTIDPATGNNGRFLPLCEVVEGDTIPTLCYEDRTHRVWQMMLRSRSEQAILTIKKQAATNISKKHFLQLVGLNTFEQEGYEGSFIAHYSENELKDDVFIDRIERNKQKIPGVSASVIKEAITGDSTEAVKNYRGIEKAVYFACKQLGMTIDLNDAPFEPDEEDITLEDYARAFHFLTREVVLDEKWWKSDCGVMIAIYHDYPVVLYPGRKGKYYIYDTYENKESILTRSILQEIVPRVWSVGRTLPDHSIERKDLLQFIKRSFRRRNLIILFVLSLISTLIGVLQPKLNQLIFDEYITLGDTSVIMQVCMLIAAFMVGNVFISVVQHLEEFTIPCRVGYDLQNAVYWRLFSLPETFFRKYESADLAERVMTIGGLANTIVSKVLTNSLSLVLGLIYLWQMFRYSWKLALASLLMIAVWCLLLYLLGRRTVAYAKKIVKTNGDAVGKLYQFLTGVDKIRMAGAEERSIFEYTSMAARASQDQISSNRFSGFAAVLQDAGPTLFSMVLYFMMVKSNLKLSVGSFMAFQTAFGALTGIVLSCIVCLNEYEHMKPTFERVKPILSSNTEDDMGKDAIGEIRGEITIEHVTFGYSKDKTVLNDVTMSIHPGEYVAVVGPSGSGKSTLLKLLLGFETPRTGKVLYDGKDLHDLNKRSLRQKIGVVLQNGQLISGSIFENIAIASNHPNMQDLLQVIEDVGLKEDIEKMPMGVHTVVSEAGGTISGGQQQRILIARAIFRNPNILLMDEATSALDNITQAKVCESLEKRHMTRLVIAHRLSTVERCDRILVMNNGKIVEEGNYQSLMNQRGLFYQMAIRQIADE